MPVVVAYLNAVSWIAGAETSLLDLIKGLDREKYSPAAILPQTGALADKLQRLDVPVRIVPFYGLKARNPLRYFETILRMANALRDFRADILHVNHQYCCGYGVLAARLARRKVIGHVRGFHCHDAIPWLNRADRVITVTQAVRKHMEDAGMRPRTRTHVVYDGVSLPVDQAGAQHNAAPGKAVVGYVGQLVPEKGVMELVAAAPIVVQSRPDTIFKLVGWDTRPEGNMESELRTKAQKLGVEDRFKFFGRQQDVAGYLRGFTVTAVPSWDEGFGRVVVESMLAGTPVVASEVGGIPEIIQNGVNGVLIPPRDPQALAAALIQSLNMQHDTRERMIEEGRKRAEFFNIESHVRKMQNLYNELLVTR